MLEQHFNTVYRAGTPCSCPVPVVRQRVYRGAGGAVPRDAHLYGEGCRAWSLCMYLFGHPGPGGPGQTQSLVDLSIRGLGAPNVRVRASKLALLARAGIFRFFRPVPGPPLTSLIPGFTAAQGGRWLLGGPHPSATTCLSLGRTGQAQAGGCCTRSRTKEARYLRNC